MKVLIIGATGVIGSAIAKGLSDKHEVIRVGHSSGDLRVDITDTNSMTQLFKTVGRVDAVVSAAGEMYTGPLETMTEEQMKFGFMHKLLGQLNVARLAIPFLNDGGSITLSSGLASRIHRPGWSVLSSVNIGIEIFSTVAALEMPRGTRINVVSPGAVTETLARWGGSAPLPISIGTPAAEVALAYIGLVEGTANGTVVDVGGVGDDSDMLHTETDLLET